MGLQIFDNDLQKKMVAKAKKLFATRGWKIVVLNGAKYDRRIDFVVEKPKMKFNISVTDDSLRAYKNPKDIYTSIFEYTGHLKGGRGESIVWVLESELPSYPTSELAKEGIAFFLPGEVEQVAQLDRYLEELPSDVSPREELLLSKNFEMCMHIGRKFITIGRPKDAIHWFTNATSAFAGFSSAYSQLFTLYRSLDDLDMAEDVALRALRISPNNTAFLQGMIELETARGRHDKASVWKEKLRQAPHRPPAKPRNFEELMKFRAPLLVNSKDNYISDKRASGLRNWLARTLKG